MGDQRNQCEGGGGELARGEELQFKCYVVGGKRMNSLEDGTLPAKAWCPNKNGWILALIGIGLYGKREVGVRGVVVLFVLCGRIILVRGLDGCNTGEGVSSYYSVSFS